jgi:hypothetical protein
MSEAVSVSSSGSCSDFALAGAAECFRWAASVAAAASSSLISPATRHGHGIDVAGAQVDQSRTGVAVDMQAPRGGIAGKLLEDLHDTGSGQAALEHASPSLRTRGWFR